MTITKHAKKRLRERLGLQKKSMQRIVNKAYYHGKKLEDFNGGVYQYLYNIDRSHKQLHGNNSTIRVYGNFIYLFAGNYLITVFQLRQPKALTKKSKKEKLDVTSNNRKRASY